MKLNLWCLPVAALMVLLGSGCGSAWSHSQTRVDRFDAVKVDQVVHNGVAVAPFESSRVYLNPRRETAKDGSASFYLLLQVATPGEFSLQPGESMVLSLDGERHGLTPTNSTTVIPPRPGFTQAVFKVSPELLVAIANSKHSELRLKGATQLVEKRLTTSNKRAVKKFLVKYEIAELRDPAKPAPDPQGEAKKENKNS